MKYSDCMLCDVKDSEGILAVGQWTCKDIVPDLVWGEGSQRVAELWVIICVGYFHNNDI